MIFYYRGRQIKSITRKKYYSFGSFVFYLYYDIFYTQIKCSRLEGLTYFTFNLIKLICKYYEGIRCRIFVLFNPTGTQTTVCQSHIVILYIFGIFNMKYFIEILKTVTEHFYLMVLLILWYIIEFT